MNLKEKLFIVNYKAKRFCIKNFSKLNETNWVFKQKKSKLREKEYCVKFCVRYRPVGLVEWILARGWWNDKGIRTEDGIFNDGKI